MFKFDFSPMGFVRYKREKKKIEKAMAETARREPELMFIGDSGVSKTSLACRLTGVPYQSTGLYLFGAPCPPVVVGDEQFSPKIVGLS